MDTYICNNIDIIVIILMIGLPIMAFIVYLVESFNQNE